MPNYKGTKYSYTPSGLVNYTEAKIYDIEKKKKLSKKDKEEIKFLDTVQLAALTAQNVKYKATKPFRKIRKKDKLSKMEKKGLI